MTDKEWLLDLADKLIQDAHWIEIEDVVARAWAARMRVIAEEIDDQVNARCVCPLCGQGHDPKLTGDSGEGKDKHHHEDGPGGGGYPLQQIGRY